MNVQLLPDLQLRYLIELGLITTALATDIKTKCEVNGTDALFEIWLAGYKHAIHQGTILDAYCQFMDAAVKDFRS